MTKIKSILMRLSVRVILWADGWHHLPDGRFQKEIPGAKLILKGDWSYALTQWVHCQSLRK